MARGKKYQPEQVVNLQRQIEVSVANGKSTEQACHEAGIVEQTYYRWRKEYGGHRRPRPSSYPGIWIRNDKPDHGKSAHLSVQLPASRGATGRSSWPRTYASGSSTPAPRHCTSNPALRGRTATVNRSTRSSEMSF
jgi:hypothetical protein